MDELPKKIGLYTLAIATLLGAGRGCNLMCNDRTVDNPAFKMNSYAIGLNGHLEYIVYSDGSQDVKEYPGSGHRWHDSELHQDLDGDGFVDRIRKNGSEFKMNRLSELLVRKHDYFSNKERFDEADLQLQELMKKYGN